MKTPEGNVCHDCGVKEGEIHHWNCDMEECPKCGCQLISCYCELTEKQATKIGRRPYIVFPNMCVRCGALWPQMFHVPDWEWKRYVPKSEQRKMLCRDCFEEIRSLIDSARAKA
jgi:hypothetical protein